jgi:hypothetical protein
MLAPTRKKNAQLRQKQVALFGYIIEQKSHTQ